MSEWAELGVGGIFALMVIKAVLPYVAARRGRRGSGTTGNGVVYQVDGLLRQQRTEQILDKLADNIAAQTAALERMNSNVTEMRREVREALAAASSE